jgi:hypothetical protein
LADLGARARFGRVGAVQSQRRRRHDDLAKLGVVDPLAHAALAHVRVVHDFGRGAHRRARDAVGLGTQYRGVDYARIVTIVSPSRLANSHIAVRRQMRGTLDISALEAFRSRAIRAYRIQ